MQFERHRLRVWRRVIGPTVALLMFILVLAGGARAATTKERTLHQFQGGSDGFWPLSSMIADQHGNLYGTTLYGGSTMECADEDASGCGTVFELKAPATRNGIWTESVLYAFQGGTADGAGPTAPMITDGHGNLYGTTSTGGIENESCIGCGTVFELSPSTAPGGAWTETILYFFKGVPSGRGYGDAAEPNNLVFGADGNLYGMAYSGGYCVTNEGGTACNGAVFQLKRPSTKGGAWTEKLLYAFTGASGGPQSAIFDKFGNLDGTVAGGAFGEGEVFSLTPTAHGAWTLTSIHDFDYFDGEFVVQGLVMDSAGNLYGATLQGGNGSGVVFQLQPPATQGGTWTENVLYAFPEIEFGDGSPTTGPILDSAGNLYGTLLPLPDDEGSVYRLTPGSGGMWNETTLYSFTGGTDGSWPSAGLVFGKFGAVYGTTQWGGTEGDDECIEGGSPFTCGVIFGIAP
jgi:uncharacterized repeat protein (TIGR03803 family)